MPELRLETQDFASLAQWRWVLTDARDTVLAEREVRLDEECWQYEAFRDLGGYLTRFGRGEDTRIVAELGAWIGAEVFGPVAAAMVSRRPATVRVVVPDLATPLLYRPMEIGCFRGRPFALHDVVLVMDIDSHNDDVRPVADRLRVLGLFSLPDGLQALNLRRERYSLVRLFRGIAAKGKAADIHVLQYGVSRDRLRDVLEEAEGWDIIHIAGHGAPGELLLETAEGKPDRITASHLADLLDLARERVKLVTVSGCSSAALVVHEQRRALGLLVTDDQVDDQDPGNDGSASAAIATELAERLGCAVLAMRYPVADDYAIALAAKLYDLLARQGQPLPRATGMTMRQLAAGSASTGLGDATFPALSLAAPVLFGSRAVGLHLRAPDRRPEGRGNRMGELKMARFPPEPARFVGRTGLMARASALLSAESGIPGVLLHGMPGAGKTSCALELAYGHEHDFDPLIWYEAPDDVTDINGALSDFARALDRHLDDFQMAHLVDDEEELAGFLPRLTEMMERFRLLIVIDNIGSLLNDGGQWRDERWGQVIGALYRDVGLGRVVLASRRVPG